jgi:hypothetical protein
MVLLTLVIFQSASVSSRTPDMMQVPLQILKPKDVYVRLQPKLLFIFCFICIANALAIFSALPICLQGLQYVDFSEQVLDTIPTSLVSFNIEIQIK